MGRLEGANKEFCQLGGPLGVVEQKTNILGLSVNPAACLIKGREGRLANEGGKLLHVGFGDIALIPKLIHRKKLNCDAG